MQPASFATIIAFTASRVTAASRDGLIGDAPVINDDPAGAAGVTQIT
jgi:hypothetical protein